MAVFLNWCRHPGWPQPRCTEYCPLLSSEVSLLCGRVEPLRLSESLRPSNPT